MLGLIWVQTAKIIKSLSEGIKSVRSFFFFFFFFLIKHKNNFVSTYINSLPTSHLLITFTNRQDPDQTQQNVGPDLDPICLTLKWYS